ncbi:MAG: hypothetical protein RL469_1048 [Pseudomonadota bacterium]
MKFEAEVIAAYGRHLRVRDATGGEHDARPFGRRVQAVCGDRVACEHDAAHAEVHVTEVLPRSNLLERATARGGAEAVVANLTQIVVVIAPAPAPDLFVADRYVAAAASLGIEALIALNKIDLLDIKAQADADAMLAPYRQAGYRCVTCSATTPESLAALRAELDDHVSVMVGQSGVGKSSLIGALVPNLDIATGALDRDAEGRHTTTSACRYDLPGGGAIIDSPGVRDFAPAIDALEPSSLGFSEVDRLSTLCRFADCQHLREPGCAVRSAAENGTLDARRYESYRRLRRLFEDLREKRGPGQRGNPARRPIR